MLAFQSTTGTMPSANHKNSQVFEKLVASLVKQNFAGIKGVKLIEIIHNARMTGLTGYTHQIDVAYRFRIWKIEMLVIVECKNYKNNVGVDELLEFRSRVEDLRAHKGVFVTKHGFQSGAIEFAEANGIALLIVRGTESIVVCSSGYFLPWREEIRLQLQDLCNSTKERAERLSVSWFRRRVVASHRGARVRLRPFELHKRMLHVQPCVLEGDQRGMYFDGFGLRCIKPDKLLKALILGLVLNSD